MPKDLFFFIKDVYSTPKCTYPDISFRILKNTLDGVINKLNTSFQEELKQEIEARAFFLE